MRVTTLWLAILFPGLLSAQNLVSNPGLDNFITCPGFGQFSNTFIVDWSKPTIASSDYYNFNCTGITPDLEFPYDGEGYAGIIAYNFGTEYREYITGVLNTPLVAGQLYEAEFYVSLHNNYIQAIEEMGCYLTAAFPGPQSNVLHLAVTPQVVNTGGALSDTSGWTKVSGVFTASGGEQFITIGNFNDDPGTTITQPYFIGSFGAYYFVDGVSVKLVAASGVSEQTTPRPAAVYSAGEIRLLNMRGVPETILITDVTGKTVLSVNAFKDGDRLPFANNPSGVYFALITYRTGETTYCKFAANR